MKILVVDDDADNARMMKVLLKLDGHEVKMALDGHAAVETARAFLPEVVLLDLTLPGKNGTQVAEELRQGPEFAGTAILAVSGHEPDDLSPAFDHAFVKPLDHDLLGRYLAQVQARRC
jgi:CheY-like chemotaxis protein